MANPARTSQRVKKLRRSSKVRVRSPELFQRGTEPPFDVTVRSDPDSRTLLDASYRSLLRSYIISPPQTTYKSLNHNSQNLSRPLVNFLSSPRVKHVDLNYIDDQTGTTLLHEAAKRKDLSLLELAVRGGADVFVRDRNGRLVYDASGTGKDDQVRVFLRQCKSLLATPYTFD